MALRFNIPLLTCTFSILTVLTAVYAEDETSEPKPLPTVASEVQSDATLVVNQETVGGDTWNVTKGEPDANDIPTPGMTTGLEFNGITANFETGAVIIVTDASNPVKITDSDLQLSWSGKKITELEQGTEESEDDFAAQQQEHERNYRITDYGGFGGMTGALDVLVDSSTITFNIDAEEPERAWYIDSYNIHIDANGATANIDNEKGIVAARTIDDMVSVPVKDGETDTLNTAPSGGTFTKTGAGTLVIGGSTHEEAGPESGLNIGGTLDIEEGTVNLAGDRELAVGDRGVEESATTEHQVKNVIISSETENESILDVSTGAMLELTNTDDEVSDILVGEKGILRIANSANTGIYSRKSNAVIEANGGTVEIYAVTGTSNEKLLANTVDGKLGDKGGTINVEGGVTFENRAITGTGDYTKTGEGTHIIKGISTTGKIIVNEGTTVLNKVTENPGGFKETSFHYFLENGGPWVVQQASKIEIAGENSVLDVTDGTILMLTNKEGSDGDDDDGLDEDGNVVKDVAVTNGGTLRIAASQSQETLFFHERGHTNIFSDGGVIEVYRPEGVEGDIEMHADSIHSFIGAKGSTFDIAEGLTMNGGNVTATEGNADVIKTGEGTSRVADVDIGSGIYDVQGGTAEFAGTVKVGTLKNSAGTTINMVAVIDEDNEPQDYTFGKFEIAGAFDGGKHNVIVGEGNVTGTLKNVGTLITGGAFDLNSGDHNADRLEVNAGTFDLKSGAWLQLTNADSETDMEVKGTLKIASAEGTGIFKKDENGSYVATNLLVDKGIVEIYKPKEGGKDYLLADTIHTTLGTNGGGISVEEGLTFESGSITGDTTGYYSKQGKGTHVINGLDIAGTVQAQGGKIVLQSGDGTGESAVGVTIAKDAVFEIKEGVSLDLSNAMTIQTGGVMINSGTLTTSSLDIAGGTLALNVEQTEEEALPASVITDTFTVTKGGKIVIGNDQLQLGTYTFDNIIEVKQGITEQALAALNGTQTGLVRTVWGSSSADEGDSDSLNLSIKLLTMEEYTKEINWNKGNVLAVARLIDKAVGDRYQTEPVTLASTFAATDVQTASSVNSIRAMIETFNNAELDAVLAKGNAGELASNAARMAMSSPYRLVFQQLNALPKPGRTANRMELGQVNTNSQLRLWFNPYGQSEEADGDEMSDGYSLTRLGFMLGGDVSLTRRIAAGIVINYGNPTIENDFGEVSANDFMIGAYAKFPLFWQISTNAMVGYGVQQYTYDGGSNEIDFDGDAIFGSLEFVRPFPVMTICNFTPVFGIDFQSIGMDELNTTLFSQDNSSSISFRPDGVDAVSLRAGLRGEFMRLRTRVQYIRQLTGDDYMTSSMVMNGAKGTVKSVQWGKDWVNVGLGGEIIQTRHFRLFADYDLDISKNATSHLGSLSAVMMW